jgi:hypothetical protein
VVTSFFLHASFIDHDRKESTMKLLKQSATFFLAALLAASCTKYKEIGDTDFYPDQKVYLPAAVAGASIDGIFSINAVAVPGRAFRYVADVPNKKLTIPLSVYRAGLDNIGAVSVGIAVNTDTVAKFLASGKFPVGTELLPADKYTLGTSVTLADGEGTGDFMLSVDLNFLLANPTKKYAVGVALVKSSKVLAASSVAIVWIDPAFLVPTANFTTTISGRTITFSNTSTNGATYSWNYGDGSTGSTAAAASYTYAAAGTYTISLTTTGALGTFNPALKTATVTVQ